MDFPSTKKNIQLLGYPHDYRKPPPLGTGDISRQDPTICRKAEDDWREAEKTWNQ